MMRLETKEFAKIAPEVFLLATKKLGSYEKVAFEIGATGHYVSDVVKGKTQPTAPMLFGALSLVAPWLVDEIREFNRKETARMLARQPMLPGAQQAGTARSISGARAGEMSA